jgi:serine/threonine protein kinase
MMLLGLKYLHGKGIKHNDFTPYNVLIDKLPDGFQILKITGFHFLPLKRDKNGN